MKKIIIFTICIFIIVGIVVLGAFIYISKDNFQEKISTVTKIVSQAILSGVVTFLGLFFTILFQEHQTKDNFLIQQRPCFIIDTNNQASAKSNFSKQSVDQSMIICNNDIEIRTLKCLLKNVKDNYGINVFIQDKNSKKSYIGNLTKDDKREINLILNAQNVGDFLVEFEDVYGNKYKQKIDYRYLDTKNKYQFFSNQPQRRK